MIYQHNHAVRLFKALADNNRLEIMVLLMNGEKCACHLLEDLKIGQSTLSHHMKILCDAGLVDFRKSGTWMYYSLSADGAMQIRTLFDRYILTPEKAQDYKSCICAAYQ